MPTQAEQIQKLEAELKVLLDTTKKAYSTPEFERIHAALAVLQPPSTVDWSEGRDSFEQLAIERKRAKKPATIWCDCGWEADLTLVNLESPDPICSECKERQDERLQREGERVAA